MVLAHIAEFDARRLYLPAAYPSMFAYCVGELHLSEDGAARRIQAARIARRFPAIFDALAEGRLHLTAVGLLAPHLSVDTANELIAAATYRSKAEIEQLLADRFPRPDVPGLVQAISFSSSSPDQHALAHVEKELELAAQPTGKDSPLGSIESDRRLVQEPRRDLRDRPRLTPLGLGRFALQFTIEQAVHDDLLHAQALLSHQIPSGDVARIFERALDALIAQLEKRKLAATEKPRPSQRPTTSARNIPAHVRRAVWQRDGGRCTFVSATGQRCPARRSLEFDHMDEVARGGEASVSRIRLRCRAHNQYEAECTFGAEFMKAKRRAAIEARAAARAASARTAQVRVPATHASAPGADAAAADDVIPWLRRLGFRADEAQRAAAHCEGVNGAPLEARVRAALTFLGRTGPGRTTVVHRLSPRDHREPERTSPATV